jgi:hypothetical protein
VLRVETTKTLGILAELRWLGGRDSNPDTVVETTVDYDRRSQINRATLFISTTAHRDRWVVPLHLRSIFPQELVVLLEKNGFRLLSRDGD